MIPYFTEFTEANNVNINNKLRTYTDIVLSIEVVGHKWKKKKKRTELSGEHGVSSFSADSGPVVHSPRKMAGVERDTESM